MYIGDGQKLWVYELSSLASIDWIGLDWIG